MSRNPRQLDPFSIPMIFLRIGWMDHYRGLSENDPQILGGGEFVKEHGYGHEIFNFKESNGRLYGYVQPPRGGHSLGNERFNIDRLGASSDQESIAGVLAIWVATRPSGGMYVVGWYKNATIHRCLQRAPSGAGRSYRDEVFGYYVTALEMDTLLLTPDERRFPISNGRGGMGRPNVWYADDPHQHGDIRSRILSYVEANGQDAGPNRTGAKGTPHQPDPYLRQKVERVAMQMANNHFSSIGYNVEVVAELDRGWDLEAVRGKIKLRVEVKGLSAQISASS